MTTTGLARGLFRDAFTGTLKHEMEKGGDPPAQWASSNKKKDQPNGEDQRWWEAHGPDMVQAWIDWRRQYGWRIWQTPDGIPAIELPVETTIDGIDHVAYIDRVMEVPESGSLVVVDLKSGQRTPDSDLQLGFYRYLLRCRYSVDVRYGAYWMARRGEITPPVDLTRYTDDLWRQWVGRFRFAVENNIFIPHPTARCRACGMRSYCAAYGGSKSHLDPDSQTQVEA